MHSPLAQSSPRRPCAGVSSVVIATLLLAPLALLLDLVPRPALACACGCGVFDVGTSSMFPTGAGGTVFLRP